MTSNNAVIGEINSIEDAPRDQSDGNEIVFDEYICIRCRNSLRSNGGHYKINGPPVNVPATLDHIAEILPRMLNDLQLHPLKLKQ